MALTPEPAVGPLSISRETERAVDRARLEMVDALHRAMYGDVWARPQSPEQVWQMMLERIARARQQFQA